MYRTLFSLALVVMVMVSGCSEQADPPSSPTTPKTGPKTGPKTVPVLPEIPPAPLRVVLTGPADQGFMGELEDSHAPRDIEGKVPMEYPLPADNFSAWFQMNGAHGPLRVQVYQGTKLQGQRVTTNRSERILIWSKSNGAVQFSVK